LKTGFSCDVHSTVGDRSQENDAMRSTGMRPTKWKLGKAGKHTHFMYNCSVKYGVQYSTCTSISHATLALPPGAKRPFLLAAAASRQSVLIGLQNVSLCAQKCCRICSGQEMLLICRKPCPRSIKLTGTKSRSLSEQTQHYGVQQEHIGAPEPQRGCAVMTSHPTDEPSHLEQCEKSHTLAKQNPRRS
jgi:hypothetical protein